MLARVVSCVCVMMRRTWGRTKIERVCRVQRCVQTIISLFLFVISFFSLSRSVFISISVWDLCLSLFVDARCIGRFLCFWLLMFVFDQRDSFLKWKGQYAMYTVPTKYLSLAIVTVNGLYYDLFHCNKLFRIWNC